MRLAALLLVLCACTAENTAFVSPQTDGGATDGPPLSDLGPADGPSVSDMADEIITVAPIRSSGGGLCYPCRHEKPYVNCLPARCVESVVGPCCAQ